MDYNQLEEIFQKQYGKTERARESFCPYRICPLGAHVDHQHGLVTGFALDKGVRMLYVPTDDGTVEMLSLNYAGKVVFRLDEELERTVSWGDFCKGAVLVLRQKYTLKRGFRAVIYGMLPTGGLSSSAAVIITYLRTLCKVNEIELTQSDLIRYAIRVEREFIGVNVGKLDQSCEVYSRRDKLLYLDTLDDSTELVSIPDNMPPFSFAIVFSGVERKLAGSAYNARVDECKAAAYALKGYAGLEYGRFGDAYLRGVPREIFEDYKELLPRNWRKRALHFYEENERVKQGVRAWRTGDLKQFGELVRQSGYSSIYLYETGSEELKALYEILCACDGVYGGRFSGAGFNGCSMAIVEPEKEEQIQRFVESEYLKLFPHLREKFSVHFCHSADGVE